jgi:RNA polymerase sigma factor (sigma-70 family)
MHVREPSRRVRFEESVLPHLDAAYNLARWLAQDDGDAEDLVQEAILRAFRFFDGFRGGSSGGSSRAWLLKIVRNTFYTWREKQAHQPLAGLDDTTEDLECESCDPETIALAGADRQLLHQAIEDLPAEFREVMVLRELEGLSYKEIALIAGVPLGTVMSRLARARKRLQVSLAGQAHREARVGL